MEEEAYDLLARAYLGERSVPGRVEIDVQGFLVRVFQRLNDGGGLGADRRKITP